MGVMWYVLGGVALVAVVVAAASVLRRPSAEDLSSVRHYHSALGTLEHLAEQNVRPVPEPGQAGEIGSGVASEAGRGAGMASEGVAGAGMAGAGQPRFYRRPDSPGPQPPGAEDFPVQRPGTGAPPLPRSSGPVPPVALGSSLPEPGAPLVFDDARPRDKFTSDQPGPATRSRMDRAQRHALDSMNRRPRRGVTMIAVVAAAIVVFVVLAVVGGQHSPRHNTGATATTGPTTASTAPRSVTPAHHRNSTSTSVPPQLVAQSSTVGSALYALNSASYHLALSASGPCWVDATSAATGSTLWTGTMQAGETQDIAASGATRVEFGTLAVAVRVDGTAVQIPSTVHSPFVLTFEPSPSPPGSAASSTPSASSTLPTSSTGAPSP